MQKRKQKNWPQNIGINMKTPWWFLHKTPLAILLLPLAWVYYLLGRVVYMFRKFGAYKSRRKIICVGNVLAGGVGKTPIVRAIANYLNAPVVMRGYKKNLKTGNVGDEAAMLARDGLHVHVGDRKSNIVLLNKQSDNSPIVMDDGFQNPSIVKDLVILVFDQSIGYGNGFLIPAGPMREPRRSVRRANAIMVIKNSCAARKFKLPPDIPVFYANAQTISPYPESEKLFAFAGIGYPRKFFASLNNVVATRAFPDHYQYTDADLKKLIDAANRRGARLITTEKDWVRIPKWAREQIKYARMDVNIDSAFFQWLKDNVQKWQQ